MSDRKRHGLVLLLVAGLICASIAALITKSTSLGLDLKGGVQLVYQAQGTPQHPKVTTSELSDAVTIMDQRVDALGVSQPQIQTSGGNEISVALPNVSNVKQAENDVGTTSQLFFYDWEANLILPNGKTVASELLSQNTRAETMSQGGEDGAIAPGTEGAGGYNIYDAVKLASKQKVVPNTPTAHLSRLGSQWFAFGAPGSAACAKQAAAKHTKPIAGQHCYLAGGQTTSSRSDLADSLPDHIKISDPGVEVLAVPQGTLVLMAAPDGAGQHEAFGSAGSEYFVMRDHWALRGSEITNPEASTTSGGQPDVEFGFNSRGAKAFQATTATIAHRGAQVALGSNSNYQHFATALDNRLLTVPQIDWHQYPDGIVSDGGSAGAEISGSFTQSSASALATQLRLGALPVTLKRISENQVSATLGKQALHDGLIAGAAGFVIVIVFLLLYYRVLGLIATSTLIIYALYFYALIKIIPVTLTLAGIAGLILTIGVAADANIVIFERVKEEIRAGRSVRTGIITGYKKGLTAIIDANVVTIITAFILFVLSTQEVQGFALTLGVGTIVSLFTAVLATQAILMTAGDSATLAKPSALGAGKPRRKITFDFMGASRYFFTMSGVILLVGALAVGGRGLKLGIDFTSGTQIQTTLSHPSTVAQVGTVAKNAGATNPTVEKVGSGQTYEISFKGGPKIERQVRDALQAKDGTSNTNVTTVGPTFGSSVAHAAIVAIIASLLVISLYVALRFEWKFAVPTLIALAHDILITVGVYALTGRQVTVDTVAALLTILGFSLYDTIIVFDRVRENIPRMPRAAFSQIVNRSMSEVITRSLATTTCTLLPIIALVLFGGAQLQDFAFALLIGVASGAYSSIFIASPVLTHWKERESVYRHRRARIQADLGHVPAYATPSSDRDPVSRRRRLSRLSDAPGEVSAEEFEQLKADIAEEEAERSGRRASTLTRRAARTDEDELIEDEVAPDEGAVAAEPSTSPAPRRTGGARARDIRAARRAREAEAGSSPQPPAPTQPDPGTPGGPVPSQGDPATDPTGDGFAHAPDEAEGGGVSPDPKQRPGSGRNRRRHGRR